MTRSPIWWGRPSPKHEVAAFDSATGMLRALSRFLRGCLAPGGTLVVDECGARWPTTRIAERYFFQHGAVGGVTAEEYRHGSPRIADYLARHGSPHRRWDAPEPDSDSPEAEWGFEPDLLPDLLDLPVPAVRLRYPQPGDLSTAVAELYRSWYRARGIPADRLLAETFVVLEPWWALRTGSVPFWMVFNTQPSRQALVSYLDNAKPYNEIRLLLFSHGVHSPGLATIDMWRDALARGRRTGEFTGVDIRAYPRDFACLARAHRDLTRVLPRYPMPEPMPLPDAEEFLADRPEIAWLPQ